VTFGIGVFYENLSKKFKVFKITEKISGAVLEEPNVFY
jgi:hypothetical protein